MSALPPSKVTDRFWVQDWAPDRREPGPRTGKWVVTVDEQDLDAAWREIRQALLLGRLGPSAKCRTAQPHPFIERDGKTVIIVYTRDSLDVKDRNRVRRELSDLGFQDVRYKTDAETLRDWRSCLPSTQGVSGAE
jgi:hypothetical protein